MEAAQQKDDCLGRQDERKDKTERKIVANNCGTQTGEEVIVSFRNGEAPKEDYIHVRAKRGQATNSHSLAERVCFKDLLIVYSYFDILAYLLNVKNFCQLVGEKRKD